MSNNNTYIIFNHPIFITFYNNKIFSFMIVILLLFIHFIYHLMIINCIFFFNIIYLIFFFYYNCYQLLYIYIHLFEFNLK